MADIELQEEDFEGFEVEDGEAEQEPADGVQKGFDDTELSEPVKEQVKEQKKDPEQTEQTEQSDDPFKGVKFDDVQQRFINERITSPLVGKRKQIEEENRYLKGVLKQHGIEDTGPKLPDVPPLPDPFDADYEQKIQERDEIIAQRGSWNAQQQAFNQQQQNQIAYELSQRNEKYYQNAAQAGIEKNTVLSAGDKILQAEVNPATIDYIMRHPDGPKITMYLSENPVALQTLSAMPPMMAVETIISKIAPFIQGKSQSREDPPPPTEQLKGGGASKLSEEDQMIEDYGLEVE